LRIGLDTGTVTLLHVDNEAPELVPSGLGSSKQLNV